jgi:DNA (cytosine-5)-methyltransferase 1
MGEMNFGSLFTGVGGFDLGFERAGMECAWQVEQDKYCNEVLERHYPEVKRYYDVREVGKHNLETVELICGGFPCQDLSIAGKRLGFDGERSSLWFEFERIIDELRPKWVVIENVPGLLSSAGGNDFATILRSLDGFGYGVVWRVLDSQYFGVAQRRRRVFIVGSLGSPSAGKVLFEQESLRRDFAPGKEERKRIAQTLAGGSSKCHSDITSGQQDANVVYSVRRAQTSSNGWGISKDKTHTLDETGGDAVAVGHSGGATLKFNEKVNTLNAQTGSETTAMFNGVWEPRSADGVPRIHEDDKSPTLNTMEGGQRQHRVGVRRLTPTECCRLQGFPDDWNDNVSDTQRYKQMGNAVTVNVIEWIGRRIINHNYRKD